MVVSVGDVALVYEKSVSGAWLSVQTIQVPSASAGSVGVRSVSVTPGKIAIGVIDGSALNNRVYVYERQVGGAWVEVAKIVHATAYMDSFGQSVSIDGDTLVVGSPNTYDLLGAWPGSEVHVFERNAAGWFQVAKFIKPPGPGLSSVAVSGDRLVVGDPHQSSPSAYVYERQLGGWIEVAKLVPPAGSASWSFGESVAISDGYVAVGSWADGESGTAAGAVHVFEEATAGQWAEKVKLLPPVGAVQYFGDTVAVDGSRLVVGAHGYGLAYFYQRRAIGVWELESSSSGSDTCSANVHCNDRFGYSVDVSGSVVVVGAVLTDELGGDSGSAYVFDYCAKTFGQGCLGAPGASPQLNVTCPSPGSMIQIDLFQYANPQQPIFLLVGTSRTNIPMGGGCTLLVSPFVGPIGPLPQSFGATIPASGALGTVVMQGFVPSPFAALGFSTTNGVEMLIQ